MPEHYTFEGSRCGTCRLPRTTPVTGCDEHDELSRVTAILLRNATAGGSQDVDRG